MAKAENKAIDFFNKYRKPILIVVAVIVLYLIWNKHGYKIERLLKPNIKNTAPIPLSEIRKEYIENHMAKIKTDIDDVTWTEWLGYGHNTELYSTLLGWYDDEIIYAADFYKNFLANGTSFYEDLDGEYFFWSDVNTRVLDKLRELGKDK